MNKFKEAWKKIRHKEFVLACLIAVLLCVFYFTFFNNKKTDKTEQISTNSFSSAEEYVDWIENKLNNVLSQISGAGKTSVLVTLESGFSYDYAKEVESRTSNGGDVVITSETVILVNGEPVVVKEWYPVIKGVVVVSAGAKDFTVKMKLLEAVETLLEVEEKQIKILS